MFSVPEAKNNYPLFEIIRPYLSIIVPFYEITFKNDVISFPDPKNIRLDRSLNHRDAIIRFLKRVGFDEDELSNAIQANVDSDPVIRELHLSCLKKFDGLSEEDKEKLKFSNPKSINERLKKMFKHFEFSDWEENSKGSLPFIFLKFSTSEINYVNEKFQALEEKDIPEIMKQLSARAKAEGVNLDEIKIPTLSTKSTEERERIRSQVLGAIKQSIIRVCIQRNGAKIPKTFFDLEDLSERELKTFIRLQRIWDQWCVLSIIKIDKYDESAKTAFLIPLELLRTAEELAGKELVSPSPPAPPAPFPSATDPGDSKSIPALQTAGKFSPKSDSEDEKNKNISESSNRPKKD